MKKLIFYLAGILCLMLGSCSNTEEYYSCDAETNDWAKQNFNEIRSMKREQWKSLPTELKKKAAFIVFSPEQKLNFWKEKLTETLALDWTETEKKHIQEVYDFVISHPQLFSDEEMSDDLRNEMDLFFYKWTEKAQSEFNWEKETIGYIISNGNEIEMAKSKNNNRTISIKSSTIDPGLSTLDCHCNQKYDFCGSQDSCEDATCNETSAGCGILLLSSCNGRCSAFG